MILDIETVNNENNVVFILKGKLNSVSAPELRDKVLEAAETKSEIIFDFKELPYVASAGLRVILEIHKLLKEKGGTLKLINVDEGTLDLLTSTGLAKFLSINE